MSYRGNSLHIKLGFRYYLAGKGKKKGTQHTIGHKKETENTFVPASDA